MRIEHSPSLPFPRLEGEIQVAFRRRVVDRWMEYRSRFRGRVCFKTEWNSQAHPLLRLKTIEVHGTIDFRPGRIVA